MSLPPPPTPDLLGLPTEIKRRIITTKLDPVDAICLALTNTHLYHWVLYVNRRNTLRALIPRPIRLYRCLNGDHPFDTLMRRFVLYLPQTTISYLLKNKSCNRSVFVGNVSDANREYYRKYHEDFTRWWRCYWLERGWTTQKEINDLEIKDALEDHARKREAQRYKKEQNKMYWDERSRILQGIKAMDKSKIIGDKGMGKEIMRRPLRKGFVSMRSEMPVV